MSNRIALVTGASSAIGEATALRLLNDDLTVYAAARRLERMAPLERAGARLITLDPTDDESLVNAVECVRRESRRIDVLVNNPGCGIYGALEEMPLAEARRQFEVNLFGAARLCQLRAAHDARPGLGQDRQCELGRGEDLGTIRQLVPCREVRARRPLRLLARGT